ncbi:MAG: 2-dehydropantoate 2-reductase N-terminal domain-containing protein [Bacillota bacterium]|nr:2-dehydropantoate 2-reductase N-terminal domain-containing protein [Bacillota bacterium]MDW7677164.1 2-dehydropantoate 2-reductase N-terminal domain-containing protein [Bacillota bacterium]
MRILVYGAGVIGSIFAGRLAAAGQNVTVLARGKRLEQIQQQGIVLASPGSGPEVVIPVNTVESLAPDDEYDFVLVVMQRTQIDDVLPVLARNVSQNLVFVVNTAGGYEQWVNAVGKNRLLLGFPSAGGERVGHKVVHFIGRGFLRVFQTTTFGEYSGQKTDRVNTLIRMFHHARIPSVFCNDMDAWQKTHVAMMTCIANALYGYHCDNNKLSRSYSDIKLMLQGIHEGFRVLNSLGIKTKPFKLWYMKLPVWLIAGPFKVFMGTKLAEVTFARHCVAAKPEMICLQAEFDELIARSTVATPAIDALRKNLNIELE